MAGLRPARETAFHGTRRGVALVPQVGCTLNEGVTKRRTQP